MTISVITATCNSAATLRDTLESLLRQTWQDYELILQDGASTDGTLEIARAYEPRFGGRMRIVSEPDEGLYDAMNRALDRARGEVVGILNSDDFYTTDDVLEQVAAQFHDGTTDAVYADVHYVRPDNLRKPVRYYSSRVFRRGLMPLGFMPAHPTFYCRRACYEALPPTGAGRYFDTRFRVAADFENLLRLIYLCRIRTRYVAADWVTMRTGGASSSGLVSHRQIMRDHLRALRQHGVRSNLLLLGLRYLYKIGEILATKGPILLRFPALLVSFL